MYTSIQITYTKILIKMLMALRRKVAENAFTLLRLKDHDLFPLARKKIAYVGIG